MDNFQALQGQQLDKSRNNVDKMNKLINEFLEMKEIDKSYLYRLVDKIEIDKEKNVYIHFSFSKLNNKNSDEFIKIEELFGMNSDK